MSYRKTVNDFAAYPAILTVMCATSCVLPSRDRTRVDAASTDSERDVARIDVPTFDQPTPTDGNANIDANVDADVDANVDTGVLSNIDADADVQSAIDVADDRPMPLDSSTRATRVRGNVRFLLAGELALSVAGQRVSINASGAFDLPLPNPVEGMYTVSVASSPAGHRCRVTMGDSGITNSAQITGVQVQCAAALESVSAGNNSLELVSGAANVDVPFLRPLQFTLAEEATVLLVYQLPRVQMPSSTAALVISELSLDGQAVPLEQVILRHHNGGAVRHSALTAVLTIPAGTHQLSPRVRAVNNDLAMRNEIAVLHTGTMGPGLRMPPLDFQASLSMTVLSSLQSYTASSLATISASGPVVRILPNDATPQPIATSPAVTIPPMAGATLLVMQMPLAMGAQRWEMIYAGARVAMGLGMYDATLLNLPIVSMLQNPDPIGGALEVRLSRFNVNYLQPPFATATEFPIDNQWLPGVGARLPTRIAAVHFRPGAAVYAQNYDGFTSRAEDTFAAPPGDALIPARAPSLVTPVIAAAKQALLLVHSSIARPYFDAGNLEIQIVQTVNGANPRPVAFARSLGQGVAERYSAPVLASRIVTLEPGTNEFALELRGGGLDRAEDMLDASPRGRISFALIPIE